MIKNIVSGPYEEKKSKGRQSVGKHEKRTESDWYRQIPYEINTSTEQFQKPIYRWTDGATKFDYLRTPAIACICVKSCCFVLV